MADILEFLSREAPQISDDVAYQWSGRVTDMVGIMFESEYSDLPLGDFAVRTAVFRRCVLFIEESLADQELSPSRIADAVGISLRYLHKIFHGPAKLSVSLYGAGGLSAAMKTLQTLESDI